MNITILDDYQDAVRKLPCFSKLAGHEVKIFNNNIKGVGQLSVRLRDTEALVLIRERSAITRALLDKTPKLKLISQTGRLGSHIDLAACSERGVAVCEGSGDPRPAAELTWALIMTAMRRVPQYIGALKHGAWQQSGLRAAAMPANFGLGSVLYGKTLGIWGYGNIGRMVATFGRAFAMNVVVWGSTNARSLATLDGHQAAASKQEFFAMCDVLSVHLRLTDSTRGCVAMEDLSLMKPTALFVNTSRAELVAPDALVAALNRGKPGLAAVDVFESEPILQGHPLLRLENAVCTPHIGFVEQHNYERMFNQAFENIAAYAEGKPTNVVNAQALSRTLFTPQDA